MAEIRDDAPAPDPGWERECLRAARDRDGRRLGDATALRRRLGSTLDPGQRATPATPVDEDGVQSDVWAATWHRTALTDD